MSRPSLLVKRALIAVHRWLGVVLCTLFLLWFPTGIAMMYWDFPSVTPADRLERAAPLDARTIRLSAIDAYAKAGLANPRVETRLNTFDQRPVYRFRDRAGETVVYADTGELRGTPSAPELTRIASRWTGQSAEDARMQAVDAVDQWTVQGPLRNLRPLWKFTYPSGEEVYVSGASGEVVQYTTTASRWGAYLGAIPHWFYFTPLRKHQVGWTRVVVWTSGVGTVAALIGIVIGVWMYSPRQRYRHAGAPTSLPYRGQKRWHTVFGLIFGLATATWAFSGMLSMDPFPPRPDGADAERVDVSRVARALRGRADLTAFATKDPRDALAQLADVSVKELEFAAFGAEPVYLATIAGGGTRLVPLDRAPRGEFDQGQIVNLLRQAAAPHTLVDSHVVTEYDAYYLDRRRERPLPVLFARVSDPDGTRLYIDPKTARVVAAHGAGDWTERWLYHGLHSLDFPLLYNHRPLWDIVVITFMVGGTALSVTSIILAWQVVGRTLRRSVQTDDSDHK